jgi:hypothetical protein
MRRWIVFAALFCAACGRETPDTTTRPAAPSPRKEAPVVTTTPPAAPALPPPAANKSTPQKCAGDGSYDRALDCFRISAGFTFLMTDAHGVLAQGEMWRSTPGMERVRFRASDAVSWVGEAKPSGVVWTRNGKHEQSPPDITNRVWQRTTMVLDPQKKEGAPQLAGAEPIGGETFNHYHFTNANSGEANDVWVSTRDGRIVKWTAGESTLRLK